MEIKKNDSILLAENEARAIVRILDDIILSLDSNTAFYTYQDEQEDARGSSLSNKQLNLSLANIRGLISSKFTFPLVDIKVEEDEDLILQNSSESSSSTHIPTFAETLAPWHASQLNLLKNALVNEFSYLYTFLKKKKQQIYGFALVLDDDCLTAYATVSTKESLKKLHKNHEWQAEEWSMSSESGDVKDGLSTFVSIMINHYRQEIVPQFQNGFDYEPERAKNLHLFLEATKLAKVDLLTKYGAEIEDMVFFLSIFGEPNINAVSAQAINSPGHPIVHELINKVWK